MARLWSWTPKRSACANSGRPLRTLPTRISIQPSRTRTARCGPANCTGRAFCDSIPRPATGWSTRCPNPSRMSGAGFGLTIPGAPSASGTRITAWGASSASSRWIESWPRRKGLANRKRIGIQGKHNAPYSHNRVLGAGETGHEKDIAVCNATRFLARAGIHPNHGRTGERRQEHGKRHHPEHGLRPKELQSAQANQYIHDQALGAHLEHEPDE